jgi:phenylalanyl-tRNA synthetase alpha chain
MMHEYEKVVLQSLKDGKKYTLEELQKILKINADSIIWAIQNLSDKKMINVEKDFKEYIELTEEGKEYAIHQFPESLFIKKMINGPIKLKALTKNEIIGVQWAKKNNWITISDENLFLTDLGKSYIGKETVEEKTLKEIYQNKEETEKLKISKDILDILVKRKLIIIKKRNKLEGIHITEFGKKELSTSSDEYIGQIDRQMILTKSWKNKKFKKYDINLPIKEQNIVGLHPMRSLINEIKEIYISQGFKEVSGPIVEPAFWVMDSLFIPQDHPARDAQDTFYLDNPNILKIEDEDFVKRMSKEHKNGWHYKWSRKEAERSLLRTHTTSVSIRALRSISEDKEDFPLKLFSVGRVFRNENADYRHLAEFYQMDGVMIGKDLTMTNLFSTLTNLYSSLGFKIRFVPTYFPFVEPGVEIQGYYAPRNEWLELGGAGMIRKEIIKGAGKKVNVLAWGPGIERIMLMRNPDIKAITELYNNGIGWVRRR